MKASLLSMFLILPFIVNAQLTSKKMSLIQNLNSKNYAESEVVGYAGTPGKTRIEFDEVKAELTNNDLVYISQNSSDALKLYSSIELIYRNDKEIIKIYKHYLKNGYKIEYHSGCINDSKEKIADLIYSEFESLENKKIIIEQAKLDLKNGTILEHHKKTTEDFVLNGTRILDKILTKKFYSIFSEIKKIKTISGQ